MPAPRVSLLFALYDARGDSAEHLRTWTHEQTLPRECYQVVVATAGGDPAVERELQALLAPGDVWVRAPGVEEIGLYDVAARKATAPWLVVTEAHCMADPDCLAQLTRTLDASPELEVALLELRQVAHDAEGRLGARWFEQLDEQQAALEWDLLPLAGFAIRREAFFGSGGFDRRYEVFANFALSARLHARGAAVAVATGAVVNHIQEGVRPHHAHSAEFTRGEFRFRADHDAEFCERYFGHQELWGRRLGYRGEVARGLARSLLTAGVEAAAGRSRDTGWLLRELARRVPAAAAGVHPYVLRDRVGMTASERLLERASLPEDRRFPGYLRAQDRIVRLTQLRWIRDHVEPPGPPARATGTWTADALDGEALVGAHGLERRDGRAFRWIEPVALLRLAPPPGEHVVTIDTGGLRGSPLDYVCGVYAGGRPVGRGAIEAVDGRLDVRLSPQLAERAAAGGLAVLSRPLDTRGNGLRDPRRLGMPVVSVEMRAAG
ncbi:MAG: hypothetical protein QOE65_2206 [Solirubrobacteraceae bacterium]|jgi:nicotinamidase-related amidase|nr:hypothetical protein [Solirubrobacteraceae bacterium]